MGDVDGVWGEGWGEGKEGRKAELGMKSKGNGLVSRVDVYTFGMYSPTS